MHERLERACRKSLEDLGLAFLELREPGPDGTFGATEVPKQSPLIRRIYSGPLILNSDYSPEGAVADIEAGRTDAVSWGRDFISNPDLPERFRLGAPIAPNENVPHSWYGRGPEGYVDYPMLIAQEQAAAE